MKQEFNFKLEGKEWEELQNIAYKQVSKNAVLDGFRPGKAPKSVYSKKYGIGDILYEAADMAIDDEYHKIITEKKLLPVIEPKVEMVKLDETEIEVKFIFVTEPEVTLGKYTNLGVKKEQAKVSKAEIKARIDSLLEDYAELEIKDGAVEDGDVTIIDFTGYKDGVEFDGGHAENYSLTIGSNSFVPGFEDGIIGMKKGETKDISLTFPKDYMAEELKGQKVVFKVTVHEIKKRIVPKLNKEFFEDLDMEGITTKEELEHEMEREITEEKEHELGHKYEEKCLEKAAENMKIEICDELIDDEIEHMYKEFCKRLQMQGISEEMYFEYTKATKDEITSSMKDDAIKGIKYRYLLKEIVKLEKIKVTDKETKEKVKELAETYDVSEEYILKELTLENIKFEQMYQKAVDIITSNEPKEKK